MRAGSSSLFLLLCLLVSLTLEVRASEGGETKPHDFLPNAKPLDLDTTADQSNHQTGTDDDIRAELRMLRDMVVEQKVELRNMEIRLKETEMQAHEQKLELLLATTSLEELRRDHAATEVRLRTSEKLVEELKKVSAGQSEELSGIRAMLDAGEREVEELKKVSKELRVDVENQAAELLFTEARVNTTESQVDSLLKDSAKVAFYTGLTRSGHVGPHSTQSVLKFSKVFTNVGNAYSPNTGYFTAPVKGVYYVRFTICGPTPETTMGVKLFHNRNPVMFNLQGKQKQNFEYLSNAVILELNVGDELHLVLPEHNIIYDNENNHSTFSGFLLFTM